MLNALRSLARTWIGKILGVFLIVGLAGFGISNVIFTLGTDTVATVAGEDITVRDFQRAYNTQLNAFAQQFGQMPTPQEAVNFGLPGAVLNRLASEAAANRLGAELGLGVSEARLSELVREDPTFAGALGAFDRGNFQRVLQQNGFTEAEYFDLQRKASRRQQLASGLFAGSPTPDAATRLVSRYTGERRSVDYFVLNAQSLPPVAEPTDEQLAAYLAEHQADFRTREVRSVDLLALSPEVIAAGKTISDEQIAAEYERTAASRQRVERRTIGQVVLQNAEQEAAFEAGKAAGTDLETLLAQTGLTVSELGTLARTQVTDPELAEAAFGLAQGDFVIIEGIGGRRAVTVSAIEPGGQVTLEEARDEIARQLALAEARNDYLEQMDQIEELRAAFQPLTQIAERFGLPLASIELTQDGAALAAVESLPEADRPRVTAAIFDASQDDRLVPTIPLSANRNVWFDLKAVEPARDQTLDEVRDAVVEAWTNAETEKVLAAEVERIGAQLAAGTPLADIALAMNQFPSLSQPLSRSGDGTTVLNQAVAAAIFSGGPTHFGSAVNGDGDYVVFQVVDVTHPEEIEVEAGQFVEDGIRDSLYADFIAALRDDAGIRVNRQALDQVLALDSTAQ